MDILNAKVTGRVQGVFFRDSTRRFALDHNLTGWVKNLPDGSVRVYAEGAKSDLDQLVAFLHVGPKYAHVDAVDHDFSHGSPKFTSFIINF